jgi:hypothetical protein
MVYKKKTKKRQIKRKETKKRQKIYRKNTKRKFRGGGRVNVYDLLMGLPLDDKDFFENFKAYVAIKPVIKFYSFAGGDDTIEIAGATIIGDTKILFDVKDYQFETIFIDEKNIKYLVCADLLKEYTPEQLKNGIDLLDFNPTIIENCKKDKVNYKDCVKIRISKIPKPQVKHQDPQVQPQVEDDQILQSRLDKICTENDRYCSDTKSIYSWAKRHLFSLDNLFKLKDDTNDEIIKALCKDILSTIDDRIQYKEWFLENCLNYYREINYDNDDNIIEEIKLLYVTTKLKELKELNKDNDIILDWAIDNLKSNTDMFNYLLNTPDTGINNFKYIIKLCFFNVHCPILDAKIKDWFTSSSSDIFFNSILFEEEENKCDLIDQEYVKYLTSLEEKRQQEEKEKRQKIINTYKDKTIEQLLEMLSKKEEEKENNENMQGQSLLPSIKKVINEIKTAIVSRKYFESQRDTLSCGRHALNNLLGRECFTFSKDNKTPMDLTIEPKSEPIDLQSLCYTMNNSIAKKYFECLDSENYDTPLLMSALCLVKYKMTEANKEKHEIINSKEFKMIVNEGGRNHWVAICRYKDDSHIYYFDSLKVSPIQYTLHRFKDEYLNNTNQLWFNVVEMSEYKNPISLFRFAKMN